MGDILLLATGVHHQEEGLVIPAGDDEVVEYAAALIGKQRVGLAVDPQPRHIHRHQGLQQGGCPSPFQDHLPHMGDIKQAGGGTGVQMLLDNPSGVLHWHIIAGEGHHFGTQLPVQRVQRCGQQGHDSILRRQWQHRSGRHSNQLRKQAQGKDPKVREADKALVPGADTGIITPTPRHRIQPG